MSKMSSLLSQWVKVFLHLLLPSGGPVFAAGPGGDPNMLGTFVNTVPIDAAFASTPSTPEIGLLIVPDDMGMQVAVQYVGFAANTLPVDAGGVVADLEWFDDSASDASTNLVAAYNFAVANNTVVVGNKMWQGWQILDPGDVLNLEFATDGTISTPSRGATVVVIGKILYASV